MLFHADVFWLVTSIFAGKACLGAFICAWPSRKLKISRAFCVVSRGRILPCHLNFCWESLLGGFYMRMAKQETENFASVWCCFTRTYLGLTPQFLLGKLAWGLGYAHGIEPTATPLVRQLVAGGDANRMPFFRSVAILNPRRTQARYHTDCHLLRRTHDGHCARAYMGQ